MWYLYNRRLHGMLCLNANDVGPRARGGRLVPGPYVIIAAGGSAAPSPQNKTLRHLLGEKRIIKNSSNVDF